MDWDAIGAIGEILGAAAVVISLIYLGAQIRQNSNWLKASVIESAGNRAAEMISLVAGNAELSRLVQLGLGGKTNEMTPDEKHRYCLLMQKAFRSNEVAFVHHKSGLLDSNNYEGIVTNLSVWTHSDLFDTWWENSYIIFNSEFVEMVNGLRSSREAISYNWFETDSASSEETDGAANT